MTQLKKYVKDKKEVEIVSEVRKNYVERYSDFLIKNGNIKDGAIVVDVPCGTGDMAKAITEKVSVGNFILIDLNKNMIESAKEKAINKATFIVGDASDIETIVDLKVDAIICLNGFHQYISRQTDFLNGCKKILKKNGRLVFDVSTRGLNDEYTKNFFQYQREEVIKLSKECNVKAQLPIWPNKEILKKYKDMILKTGLKLIEEKEFISSRTVSEILSDAITIPGRSRPWIPDLDYNKRKVILKKSIENTIEKLGKNKIEHNRIFFIAEKM